MHAPVGVSTHHPQAVVTRYRDDQSHQISHLCGDKSCVLCPAARRAAGAASLRGVHRHGASADGGDVQPVEGARHERRAGGEAVARDEQHFWGDIRDAAAGAHAGQPQRRVRHVPAVPRILHGVGCAGEGPLLGRTVHGDCLRHIHCHHLSQVGLAGPDATLQLGQRLQGPSHTGRHSSLFRRISGGGVRCVRRPPRCGQCRRCLVPHVPLAGCPDESLQKARNSPPSHILLAPQKPIVCNRV